jgi:peroxiredoxin
MRTVVLTTFGLACLAGLVAAGLRTYADEQGDKPTAAASQVGRPICDFTLRDFRGKEVSLRDFKDRKLVVVAFLGVECPLAKLYGPRLASLAKTYAPQGVAFIAINSNQQDSITELAHYARTHQIEFPLLKDPGNVVADQFGAERTPEVFVLNEQRAIAYRGRIDDQYVVGRQRTKATQNDLAAALDELLAGKPVTTPVTEAVGCFIGKVARPDDKSEVTYWNQIARIFQARCVECHRPGQIAPFSLTSYEEAAGWAETIAEVVRQQRMPPWHADPRYGQFANDARLSEEQKSLIYRWVEAGAPQGDPNQAPPPRTFAEGWAIPKPDQIIYMSDRPFQVPAEGEVRYQYFFVDPGFKEDKWVQAAECRPGNRSVVHHIIVAVRPPGSRARVSIGDVESDWLVATAPGGKPLILEPGMAKLIPAGSQLIFQIHYTANGSPQEDRSAVGLVFADPHSVKKPVATWRAASRSFVIPPGAANHRVEASYAFRRNMLLLSMFPHMHLRGKAFRYEAEYPDGRREVLLDVPQYDFNWQNTYVLAEPKLMPAGTRLRCTAHFDNSPDNLANPNPAASVRWGDQTWEEMMIGYFNMAPADDQPADIDEPSPRTRRFVERLELEDDLVKIDPELRKLAAAALDSRQAFAALGEGLQSRLPMIDRVCLTLIADERMRIEQALQDDELRNEIGGAGLAVRARGLALPEFAAGKEPVVLNDLSAADKPDLVFMKRALRSSFHVPVVIDGKPGTINFWSKEKEAFPQPITTMLQQLAETMAKDRGGGVK